MYALNNLTLAKNFNSDSFMQDVLKSGCNFLGKHSSFSPDNEFTTIHKRTVTRLLFSNSGIFFSSVNHETQVVIMRVRLSAAVRFLCLVLWYSTPGQAFHLAIRQCSSAKAHPHVATFS